MNERIKELANIWANRRAEDEKLGIVYTFSEPALEKFAQLIVRECGDMLREREEHMHTRNNPISSIRSDECHIMADYIETHFGVEK